jgi:hypothetical protein
MTELDHAFRDRPPERYIDAQGGAHDDAAIPHYLSARYPTYLDLTAVANAVDTAIAGEPGSFTPVGAAMPANLIDIQSMGALGQTTVWADDAYVVLLDGSQAHWDGVAWVVGPALAATGVDAGEPGVFTPPGADRPVDLAALTTAGALGETTTWATDEYVVLGDLSNAYWNGTAWTVGITP